MASGDGWIWCAKGHRHWGKYGAAGAVLRYKNPEEEESYLLGLRAAHTHSGGVWGTIGGALDSDDTPLDAVLREMREELGGYPAGEIHYADVFDCDDWRYTTLLFLVDHLWEPPALCDEIDETRWFTPDEIEQLPLHAGFAITWQKIKPHADL